MSLKIDQNYMAMYDSWAKISPMKTSATAPEKKVDLRSAELATRSPDVKNITLIPHIDDKGMLKVYCNNPEYFHC